MMIPFWNSIGGGDHETNISPSNVAEVKILVGGAVGANEEWRFIN